MSDEDKLNEQLRQHRKRFLIKSYLVFVLFVVLTLLQNVLFLFNEAAHVMYTHLELCVISLFVALVMIIVFIFLEPARFKVPLNWILALLIVEGITFALARITSSTCGEVMGICILAVVIPVLVAILLGTFLKHDFTLDIIVLFVLSFIFFISGMYFVTLYVLTRLYFAIYALVVLVYIIVFVFIMYHVQTLSGKRYAEMRLKDYLLGGLMLYIDFIILYMVVHFMVMKLWENDPCTRYRFDDS